MGRKFFLLRWLDGLFKAIGRIFNKLDKAVQDNIGLAIDIVNRMKEIDDTFIDDVIAMIIPGAKDDKILADLREWLPKAIIALNTVKDISSIQEPNEKIKAILAAIKAAPDETRKAFWHGMASLIVERVSDGKLDFNDAAILAAYYYKNHTKEAA